MKQLGQSVRGVVDCLDTRLILSDHWVPSEEVDCFKDEVKPCVSHIGILPYHSNSIKSTKQAKANDNVDIDDDWEDIEDQTPGLRCIDCWRNAGPEECKRMFALFDESGIFIASCHHRFVLLACDMVKSGELYIWVPFLLIFLIGN